MKRKWLALVGLVMAMMSMAACAVPEGTEGAEGGMSIWVILIYFVVIIGAMYFIAIRPQKKQQKQQAAMLTSLEVNDVVLTTSGFYGVVIDITDDTVIVEFGNNKNCRIPMQKSAIVEAEKPDSE